MTVFTIRRILLVGSTKLLKLGSSNISDKIDQIKFLTELRDHWKIDRFRKFNIQFFEKS